MPRGQKGTGAPRRRKTIDEKIATIDKSIEMHKDAIAGLSNRRKALVGEREQEKNQELLKIMDETGLTADQLIELVKNNAGK